MIFRSDNGETWYEHSVEATEEAIHQALNGSFEGEGDYMSRTPGWMLMREAFYLLLTFHYDFSHTRNIVIISVKQNIGIISVLVLNRC